MMCTITFDPQPALLDMRFVQCLAKIKHRGKGDILVIEPSHPFIARLCEE